MLLFLIRIIFTTADNSLVNISSSSMSSFTTKTNNIYSSHKSYMYLINFLLISILLLSLSPTSVSGQDFYGASYANNRSPDEIRQRSRDSGFDEPVAQDGAVNEIGAGGVGAERQGCPGPWQWQCDSGHCIAQYDLCDGVTQCPDESDEKNCRGRFGPSQHINSYRQQPEPEAKKPLPKPSTTDLPKTTLHPSSKDSGSILLPLKLVFAGAAAFILVAGLTHVFVKRRQLQATVRNYRKGQSLVDDEDDLLISQMYS